MSARTEKAHAALVDGCEAFEGAASDKVLFLLRVAETQAAIATAEALEGILSELRINGTAYIGISHSKRASGSTPF